MSALSIRNLTKTYQGGVQALQGIDLDVQEGDFFALLGPNGAGKSTTIGIITSLVNKSAGKVKIFGHDIDEDFSAAKACLGVVPQEFNFNVFEPIQQIMIQQAGYYGIKGDEAIERTEFLLKKLELWAKRKAPPRSLSGGMKRRFMIARAMVHNPRLLILDEPTAGVDIEIRRALWQYFREVNEQGTTVILTTHYLEEAENLCNNIAIINHGHIVENTSMKQLLAQLQMMTLVLDIKEPLKFAPELNDFRCHLTDSTTLEVEIDKSQAINTLFNELNNHNIDVMSMRNKANRLEELFLGLISQS